MKIIEIREGHVSLQEYLKFGVACLFVCLFVFSEFLIALLILFRPELDDHPRSGFKQRLFCDICDEFDKHDTDDCPTQASGPDDGGVRYHGDRAEQRAYCDTCEGLLVFFSFLSFFFFFDQRNSCLDRD